LTQHERPISIPVIIRLDQLDDRREVAGCSIRDSSCLTALGVCTYSIYFFSFTPMAAPSVTRRHSTQPNLPSRLTISLQGTISSGRLFHIGDLHHAMRCQRPPAKQCDQNQRTNSLRSKLIYSLRLFLKHQPEPPHDHAMCRHPTRLPTCQECIKARNERRDPEIHRSPSSREKLGWGSEGVPER